MMISVSEADNEYWQLCIRFHFFCESTTLLVFLLSYLSPATNRSVISFGLVIAPPTTIPRTP